MYEICHLLDAHIRNLTPELPASLADRAQVELIGELQFRDLLRTIADLSAGQKNELKRWYSAVARKLVGANDIEERISVEFAHLDGSA